MKRRLAQGVVYWQPPKQALDKVIELVEEPSISRYGADEGLHELREALIRKAVMASDFSVAQFRFLERFLDVHGHWCYKRIAQMVCYFSYKEMLNLAIKYKAMQEEDELPHEKLEIANVGQQDAKKHLEEHVSNLMSLNIVQTLGTMLDIVVF